MSTLRLVFLSSVLLFVLSTCRAWSPQELIAGQMEASGNNPSGRTIWISAHSKNGLSTELSARDFEVKIDGKPVSVSDARRVSPSLSYCLLLDDSGSTRATRNTKHDEAVALLSKIPRAGRDYGLLVTFNNQAYLDAESSDPQKLIKSINQDSRGATAMYDAMIACSDHLSKNGSPKDGLDVPLRVAFVLSDGVDNYSRTTVQDAERNLIQAGIRVYSIGEGNVGNYRPDEVAKASKSLKQLVESTGGKDYLLSKRMTIDQIVQDISSDLSNLYAVTLSFERAASTGHVYKLEIRCGKADCAVAAPHEYFASH